MSSRRPPLVGRFSAEEITLATRNRGMPLEALRDDITPTGLHYLLVHFDIPALDAERWRLVVRGRVRRPLELDMAQLRALSARTERVTLECAGNGRAQVVPRYPSVPWVEEGVSTAEWTGVPLAAVLERAGLEEDARHLVFRGVDRGFDAGVEHDFARSLSREEAAADGVLLAYAMNGAPLPPQHGAPVRLIVPRWYGMASVKWLHAIEAIDRPFDGLQQASSYHFRAVLGEKGEPCTFIRVNSLMVPPGIPDFYSRRRVVQAGRVTIVGRAWSGSGPVTRVEVADNDVWREATVEAPPAPAAWQGWRIEWDAHPGEHELACRATDIQGGRQPLQPPWDLSGFGNNGVQRVSVSVRP